MAEHSLSPLDSDESTAPTVVDLNVGEIMQAAERATAGTGDTRANTAHKESNESPLDLALSLVFREIAEQARLATTATGAAIGLARGSQVICRAVAGATAPEVAACLNNGSGISEACLRSGRVQLSEDAEADPRLDAASCRRLGVRSILMVPVQNQQERLGVIAIFSPRAHAFSDKEVSTLQGLSRRVIANLELAKEAITTGPLATASGPRAARPSLKIPRLHFNLSEKIRNAKWIRSWNSLLMVLLIALSLLVGWMFGRAGRRPVRQASARPTIVSIEPEQSEVAPPAPMQATPASVESTAASEPKPALVVQPPPQSDQAPSADDAGGSVAEVTIDRHPISRPTAPKAKPAATKTKPLTSNTPVPASKSATAGGQATDLVVFEDKKQAVQTGVSSAAPVSPVPALPRAAVKGSSTSTGPVVIPEETAKQYLVQRIEPDYPRKARAQHIQGRVVMDVIVSKDGAVEAVGQVSGDPQLASAAANAIRQWHFKPFLQNGQPVEFESRMTVNFVLP